MATTGGGESLDLLVADGEAAFASDVAQALEATDEPVTAEAISSAGESIARGTEDDVDAVVMGNTLDGATNTIKRLTNRTDCPVVLLTDATAEESIQDAVEAGVTDVFPRVTATGQYELLVERLTSGDSTNGGSPDPSADDDGDWVEMREAYRAVFENVSDGLVVHDAETGEITDVNERFCEMNGYDRGELVGKDIGIVTAPAEEYSYEAAHEKIEAAQQEGPQLFEWRNQRQNGETFPVEVHLSIVSLHGEQRVLASVRDISERKRREREYEQIFNGVNDSIVIHDPETGEMIDANETFCDLLGYDRETVLDLGTGGVSVQEEGFTEERAQEIIDQVMDGETKTIEWMVETKDGEHRRLEVTATAIEIGGEPQHVSLMRDITERTRREREYEQIFNGVNESIVIQDPETAEPLDANQTFLDRLGYDDVSEIREVGFEELSATDAGYTKERAQDLCQQVIETGEAETVEWQQETSDGERRWIEGKIDSAIIGGEERILSMQRDITERKRREEMVRALHESTDALHEADTPEDVCEATVRAAREVLDLSMPACWLHRGEEPEVLSPVAATEEAREAALGGDSPGTFEPGDFQYEVYEEGGMRVYDPGDIYAETPLDRAALIALGDHGIFGAAEAGVDSFDDVTLDAARILARHATTALDRVERARELRESERRFRLIAEHIDEIIYLASADFSEILYINPAYEEIYGRPTEELEESPTSFVEAAHPEDRDRYVADVQALIEDVERGEPEDAYGGEYRIQRDGDTRWVTVTRFPIENEAGSVDRIVGQVQDITERKRREREFEQIFHSVNDAITIHDPETGEMLDMNDSLPDLLGYDREDVFELGIDGFSLEGYTMERAREFITDVVESGEPRQTEWAVETSDGEVRWLEVRGTTAEIGGEERFVALDRDITEQRRSEQRFRTIAERVEEIIYLANADLTEVQYVNPAYAEVFGRPVEELYEDPEAYLDAIHPEDSDAFGTFLEAMLDDIESGTPDDRYEFAYRIRRPDGDVRWLETTGYPILTETDEPHRYVSVTKDVTDQRRREQTLETFHEATRELTEADSREAACRQAVAAAEEVLGFPLVSAFLYEDTTGRLEPTAATTRLRDLDVDLPEFGPGESLPWQVYVEGDAVTNSKMATDVYGPGVSGPDVVLPLGSHGVMLVGAPTDDFDGEDIELAQILAATLEAALNHVADERTLGAREEELRRQEERAARLERLNTIIRDIEQATVEQSSRAGIEEAVCERLIDVGAHDLVWIAEPAVGDGELLPRTSEGDDDAYMDALTVDIDTAASGHPAIPAYRQERANIVENVATDVGTGEWRTIALQHGIQSVISVPIQYETTTHGVLTVASAEPDAFDDATQDVLAELGRSIGYAITVTEREQALESEGTTELEFAIEDDGLFLVRGSAECDCRIKLERTIRRTGGSFSMFYVVEDADPEQLVELANAAPSVETAQVVSAEEGGEGGLIEVTAPTWFGSVFTEHGAVVRDASADHGEGSLIVEAPRGADVRTLVEGFGERYPDTELLAQRQRERTIRSLFELQDALQEEVTDRQWEALETAYSAGYFGWPRETSGQEVADLLGVTQPTFNKHLRIAEQAAFQMLLDREYPQSEADA